MNKVTLSVVALAAIGAPVQSQAADQTEAEKLQATYDEVCGILNTAINEVNGYHDAVKAQYLGELSNIQKEIDAAKTAGTIDKAYFTGKIDTVKADALNREKQYVANDKIDAAFKALTVEYNNALKQVQNGSYPNVGANKTAWLEGELGYSELKATVEALDPATQNDIASKQTEIESDCTAMQESIKSMLDGIAEEEENVASNEKAYKQIDEKITNLKNAYNEQLQELLKLLPGDPDIYGDWQAKAIDELNEQQGAYDMLTAARDYSEHLHGVRTDSMLELSYQDRKRIHNLKYYTWVEQQGKTYEEINQQWYDTHYWTDMHAQADELDKLINEFNDATGVLANM